MVYEHHCGEGCECSVADRVYIHSNDYTNSSTSDNLGRSSRNTNHVQEIQMETNNLVENGEIRSAETKDALIMLEKLKSAFSSLEDNDPRRVRILTIAPDHWSLKKVAEEFNTTIHYARKAREVLKDGGLFADPNGNLVRDCHNPW